MNRRAVRRLAAVVALVATLIGLASPARAMLPRAFGDLCVGGKLVPGAPASLAHDCDACCASTPTALAGPAVAPVFVPFVQVAGADPVAAAPAKARTRAAQARAPPVS